VLIKTAVSASMEVETIAGQQEETVFCTGVGGLMCLVLLLYHLLGIILRLHLAKVSLYHMS